MLQKFFLISWCLLLSACSSSWKSDVVSPEDAALSEFDSQAKELILNLDQEEINSLRWTGEGIQVNGE